MTTREGFVGEGGEARVTRGVTHPSGGVLWTGEVKSPWKMKN